MEFEYKYLGKGHSGNRRVDLAGKRVKIKIFSQADS